MADPLYVTIAAAAIGFICGASAVAGGFGLAAWLIAHPYRGRR